jgi:hypothetical protein
MDGIEIINDGDDILAIIIRASFNKEGLSFITPNEFPLQMGVHIRTKGFLVRPHTHIDIFELKNITAQEIFYLQKGRIKVTVYNNQDKPYSKIIVETGDTILLAAGHSMEYLEDSKMVEIKQGPYRGAAKEKRYLN